MEKFSLFDWKKREILFVTLVLAGIFGISYYQLKIGEMKTRDGQRMSDVDLISRAVRKYYDDYQIYPMEATGEGKILSCGYLGQEVCEWGQGPMMDADGVIYLNKLPRDPLGDYGYTYVYQTDVLRKQFKVYAAFEYNGEPGFKSDLTTRCGDNVQCSWYVGP